MRYVHRVRNHPNVTHISYLNGVVRVTFKGKSGRAKDAQVFEYPGISQECWDDILAVIVKGHNYGVSLVVRNHVGKRV